MSTLTFDEVILMLSSMTVVAIIIAIITEAKEFLYIIPVSFAIGLICITFGIM